MKTSRFLALLGSLPLMLDRAGAAGDTGVFGSCVTVETLRT